MKKYFFLLAIHLSINGNAHGQHSPADCKHVLGSITKKLNDRISAIVNSGRIENTHISKLGDWLMELKELVDNNSFDLFSATNSPLGDCNSEFPDICRNFFSSNYQYLFKAGRFSTLEECTESYADEWNTPETAGRLKKLSFAFHAISPLCNANTLQPSEKNTYSPFYEFLLYGKNPNDPGIYAFFYTHLEDIKKATGFDPNPGTEDKKSFAQNFMLSFQPHLQYYFGVAEEEYIRSSALNDSSDIRGDGLSIGAYRRLLHTELANSLRAIVSELNGLIEKCDENGSHSFTGLKKTITNYAAPRLTEKEPVKPSGEAQQLRPGHVWVLLNIHNANGRTYKEFGDRPLISLFMPAINNKKYDRTIRSSEYNQVPAGNYIARISMPAQPQRKIVITGQEIRITLRLGRLILDPRSWDGSPGRQDISVVAVIENSQSASGAVLTSPVITYSAKAGDSLDLAPGRYAIRTKYGITETDTVIIRSDQCTRFTISGHAKFKGAKKRVEIRKVMPNRNLQEGWIAILENEGEIELPPGLYDIKSHGPDRQSYRIQMESGHSYVYQPSGPGN